MLENFASNADGSNSRSMTHENATTENTTTAKTSPTIKMLVEFGPLIVFFITYKYGKDLIAVVNPFIEALGYSIEATDTNSLFAATGVFMVSMIGAMILSHTKMGHISAMLKFTFIIVMVMGGLTLYLQDETFVKLKPSLIYSLFATILAFGLIRGKLYLKAVMQMALEIDDEGWRKLTYSYIGFFLLLVAANEYVWRTYDTDTWVNFKTFGITGALFVFIIAQMPFLMKYIPKEDI